LKKFAVLILLILPSITWAAGSDLVLDAVVTSVANTSSNEDKFTVWVSGGTGVCANTQISFPKSKAGSAEVFDRAYSAALTAFVSGTKVRIYNYTDDSCYGASYIRLTK